MSKAITMPDDFLDGQRDCQQGEPPKQGASDDYTRGYSAQYQHEQNMSELSRGGIYGLNKAI